MVPYKVFISSPQSEFAEEREELITTHLFDENYNDSATLDDIDEKKIQNFIRLARFKRGFPLSEMSYVAQVLEHLKMKM